MMGVMVPEICWTNDRFCNKKTNLFHLVGLLFLRINPLNGELNPICHLLALLGGATIVVVSRLRVNDDARSNSQVLLVYI